MTTERAGPWARNRLSATRSIDLGQSAFDIGFAYGIRWGPLPCEPQLGSGVDDAPGVYNKIRRPVASQPWSFESRIAAVPGRRPMGRLIRGHSPRS